MDEKLDTQSRNVEKRFDTVQIFASAFLPLLGNWISDLVKFESRKLLPIYLGQKHRS